MSQWLLPFSLLIPPEANPNPATYAPFSLPTANILRTPSPTPQQWLNGLQQDYCQYRLETMSGLTDRRQDTSCRAL
ncbi:hypothetical protein AAFF_G00075410 [Aldrovandia affinis]|uniref:Uncharacterized protein n=1 Tax=Aldrovandia affinis TaxID=143900 RepID=A0AAD7RXW5_9TELE|nr:hypothetical protein AAFF_G00075410 [Aldrovandia affinis]